MRKDTIKEALFLGFVLGFFVLLGLIGEGVISFEYPQSISKEQLQSLRLTSFISDLCLPDSISHYEDSIVLKDSSALLFRYDYDASFLLENVKSSLQSVGFVITDSGKSRIDNFDFYWLSAENGDIFTHVTAVYTGTKTHISIASGKDVKEVLSIKIVTDRTGDSAELRSDYTYKPENTNIVLTAPLAGTVYAIYYPNNPLCGKPSDEINIITRRSFDEFMLKGNMTPPILDFYWACGNVYKPARFKPTNAFVYKPRGVAYAQVISLGGGLGIK